jgi:hypothetical protein
MDTKVIGRTRVLGQDEAEYPKITNIVVLNLTKESHGNATGIGLADYTTEKVLKEIDLRATTINGLTSMSPDQIKLPVINETDREAVKWACYTLGPIRKNNLTMAYIKNTASLETLAVSENLLNKLGENVYITGKPKELCFDTYGKLIPPL